MGKERLTLRNIILTGYPGTGKSTVGKVVARILGWWFIDVDREIAEKAGKTIAAIFEEHGEEHFRRLERDAVREACAGQGRVVAVGGGAVTFPENRESMEAAGVVVCLDALPETIHQRLQEQKRQQGMEAVRPLLESQDQLARIRQQKAERQPAYATAHWTVNTNSISLQQAADEVVRAWRILSGRPAAGGNQFAGNPHLAATVHSSAGECPLLVGWGLLSQIGEVLSKSGVAGPVYLISDHTVAGLYGEAVQAALELAGIESHLYTFTPGEASKTLATAGEIYHWLAERRAQRGHVIVALGGGVVGDLAGFVAATYTRGMRFVQVPTSIAAMMDSSIGGKTAVDLPQAKNLVGAFHQPLIVVADVSTLLTLPVREAMEGWAEAIKHGLILDAGLFETFEQHSNDLIGLEHKLTTEVIKRSMSIKAEVVSQDERETLGYRNLLNYGHTIGHALEAATEYGRLLHGEAVAIGMMGAAGIGVRMGVTPVDVLERQEEVLRRFDLPVRISDVDIERVEAAMTLDKKAEGSNLRWVLLEGVGRAVVRNDVPYDLMREVLAELAG